MVNFFHLIIKAIGKVIGLAFIITGVIMAIWALSYFFGGNHFISISSDGINTSISKLPFLLFGNHYLFEQDHWKIALVGIALVCGIPIVGMLFSGLKLLFGIRHRSKAMGIVFATLWLIGLIICGVAGLQVANHFTQEEEISEIHTLNITSDTLFLQVTDDPFRLKKKKRYKFHKSSLIKINEDSVTIGNPTMDILRGETASFEFEIIRSSRGETQKVAADLAEKVSYYFNLKDSLLCVNPWFSIESEQWRAQDLELILHVPDGKSVHIGKRMDRIIYDVDNSTNTQEKQMTSKTWTMLAEGLTCIACDEEEL